jgi:guanylate kinase
MFSISYTTRRPRGAEVDGQNYRFVSREKFEAMLARDEFLEWAEVFGNYYGTHRGILEEAQSHGRDLVLDIDVQGARQLKCKVPEAVTIFILAPSRQILEQRLRARSEDPDDVIERRLRDAAAEIRNYSAYDYVLINRDLSESDAVLGAIVRAERVRRTRIMDQIDPILRTFEV